MAKANIYAIHTVSNDMQS